MKSCQFINDKYDDLVRISDVQATLIKEMTGKINKMSVEMKEKDSIIENLVDRVQELEQNQLQNNLEIYGIPQQVGNLNEVVNKIAAMFSQPTNGILESYRLQTKRANYVPPIIVKFATKCQRDAWLSNKRAKEITVGDICGNESKSRVYINEHLSAENKKLLWECKTRGKAMNYQFVWCKWGKIFARKGESMELNTLKI